MFFLSAKDESQSPGPEHCCSTALMIPNSNFILKTIFCRSTQVKIKSEVNYHPTICIRKDPLSLPFCVPFSAKQCISDVHLRVRENPAGQPGLIPL